jgi:hypothetical protein
MASKTNRSLQVKHAKSKQQSRESAMAEYTKACYLVPKPVITYDETQVKRYHAGFTMRAVLRSHF